MDTHLVRDVSDINLSKMLSDLPQRPPFISIVLPDAFSPQYSIDVILLVIIDQPIPVWEECSNFFAVNQVQGVYPRRSVSVTA